MMPECSMAWCLNAALESYLPTLAQEGQKVKFSFQHENSVFNMKIQFSTCELKWKLTFQSENWNWNSLSHLNFNFTITFASEKSLLSRCQLSTHSNMQSIVELQWIFISEMGAVNLSTVKNSLWQVFFSIDMKPYKGCSVGIMGEYGGIG